MAISCDKSVFVGYRDRLESLHRAYVGVEVLAGMADIGSHHVAAVLAVINESLDDLIHDFGTLSVRGPSSGLHLVE